MTLPVWMPMGRCRSKSPGTTVVSLPLQRFEVSTAPWQPFKNMAILPSPPRLNKDFDGRRLPDVAGLAASLYCIYVEGGYLGGVGGTSAVPALWAALIARVNEGLTKQGLNRIGDFNPLLYETSAIQNTFNDITCGDNGSSGVGGYEAGIGWDACTGWGTPNGTRLLQELAK